MKITIKSHWVYQEDLNLSDLIAALEEWDAANTHNVECLETEIEELKSEIDRLNTELEYATDAIEVLKYELNQEKIKHMMEESE